MCNAGSGGDHIGHLCSQDFEPRGQCEWLERELAQAEPRKIVFVHVPPHPAGEDAEMFMARNDSRYFNALVEQTRPTALFCGHQHQETREFRIGDTRGFILRSCAWNFPAGPHRLHARPPHSAGSQNPGDP